MVRMNTSSPSIPVGREKERNPLGHSGQRRLQLVVGSMLMLTGMPQCTGFFSTRDTWYELHTFTPFQILRGVSLLTKFIPSLKLRFIAGKDNQGFYSIRNACLSTIYSFTTRANPQAPSAETR